MSRLNTARINVVAHLIRLLNSTPTFSSKEDQDKILMIINGLFTMDEICEEMKRKGTYVELSTASVSTQTTDLIVEEIGIQTEQLLEAIKEERTDEFGEERTDEVGEERTDEVGEERTDEVGEKQHALINCGTMIEHPNPSYPCIENVPKEIDIMMDIQEIKEDRTDEPSISPLLQEPLVRNQNNDVSIISDTSTLNTAFFEGIKNEVYGTHSIRYVSQTDLPISNDPISDFPDSKLVRDISAESNRDTNEKDVAHISQHSSSEVHQSSFADAKPVIRARRRFNDEQIGIINNTRQKISGRLPYLIKSESKGDEDIDDEV